jgi:hypothetical protein
MKCVYCYRKVNIDLEMDLVHNHLEDKGCDARMCEPNNPDSKIARIEVSQ